MTYSKYNAYNALVEGSSVCQGYAEAYRYLCSRVGLDVKVVSSENLNHAWNIVALNNRYYFVDTTWDDPANITDPAYCGHRNFMRSTQGMVETDHTSTDWIREDGVNVYSYGTDSTLYDNSDWKDKRGAILVGEEVIKVTGISLSPTSTKLITGKTTTLKATITPSNATDKSVTWSSSNKSVATVDSNGVVKAVGAGSATITVTAKDGSGIKSTCKVTVSDPEPKKDTESKSVTDEFDDIKPGEWWVEAIQYVYDRKIMVGTGSLFEPAKALPREQFVQVLYNLSGQPSVKNISNKFPDVKNDWYKNAVLWASANGITNGYRNGKFGVGDGITREQMTVMLYNYAKLKNFDLSAKKGMTDQFKDGKAIDSWAKEAMNWAVSQGIMSGKGSGKDKSKLALDPLGGATRAECAALIMKLLVKNGL